MIGEREVERRLRRVSQLRALILEMKREARRAFEEGKLGFCPRMDQRSDHAYWLDRAIERGLLPRR